MSQVSYSVGPGVVIKKKRNPTGKKIEKRYKLSSVDGSESKFRDLFRLHDYEENAVVKDEDGEIIVDWTLTDGSEFTVTYTEQ